MAFIIHGLSRCPLCDVVIQADDDLVATTHFIASQHDPLWRFSDTGMHRSCFLAWELRAEFVAHYNQLVSHLTWGNGTYKHMSEDGTVQSLRREPPARA